jgi:hypothetical protein
LLAGGTAPDEATRQASLKRITTQRVTKGDRFMPHDHGA